jgi:hypothetical protein
MLKVMGRMGLVSGVIVVLGVGEVWMIPQTWLLVVYVTAAQKVRFMLQRSRGDILTAGKPLKSPFAE